MAAAAVNHQIFQQPQATFKPSHYQTTNNHKVPINNNNHTNTTTMPQMQIHNAPNPTIKQNNPTSGTSPPVDYSFRKILKRASLQLALTNYRLGKTLGEGRYGKVKMGEHILTKRKVAVKILTKTNIHSEQDFIRIQREIRIVTHLNHDNIIKVYDIVETPSQLFIVMEFAEGGDLYSHLINIPNSCLKPELAIRLFRQLVSAISYCHTRLVVHRDLKPENILLDEKRENVKIADFGFSRTFPAEGNNLATSCGSLYYAAPEILEGKKYHGPEVDVWSLGVIFFVMLTGEMPFQGATDHELARNIKQGKMMDGPLHSLTPEYTPVISIIKSMLTVDVAKRAKLPIIQLDPSVWVDRPLQYSLFSHFAKVLCVGLQHVRPISSKSRISRCYSDTELDSPSMMRMTKRNEKRPSPAEAKAKPSRAKPITAKGSPLVSSSSSKTPSKPIDITPSYPSSQTSNQSNQSNQSVSPPSLLLPSPQQTLSAPTPPPRGIGHMHIPNFPPPSPHMNLQDKQEEARLLPSDDNMMMNSISQKSRPTLEQKPEPDQNIQVTASNSNEEEQDTVNAPKASPRSRGRKLTLIIPKKEDSQGDSYSLFNFFTGRKRSNTVGG